MRKIVFMTLLAMFASTIFCEVANAQDTEHKQTRREKREAAAAEKARMLAEADSLAKLEASLVDGTEMTFKYTDHNFGTVASGSDVSYEFEYVNTGKAPLIINNVSTSCGCTTPEWTREPVPSKGRGKIKVKYDSNRIGSFSKTITVYSNAKNSPVVLSIKGTVEVRKN